MRYYYIAMAVLSPLSVELVPLTLLPSRLKRPRTHSWQGHVESARSMWSYEWTVKPLSFISHQALDGTVAMSLLMECSFQRGGTLVSDSEAVELSEFE
eukprot:3258770-Amphidinium_carterae.1